MNNFSPPSDKALSNKPITWQTKYADSFNNCPAGMSFSIDKNDVKGATLRSVVSKRNTDSRIFKVVEHETHYEIYRKV